MDKKEIKHLKEEHHHHKDADCNCGPECKCGCQEGGECHCGEHCDCGCGCGCHCKRKAMKLLSAVLIFALGFFAAKIIGCKPCMRHMPHPIMGMQAPFPTPSITDGTGNTFIIINTDGNTDISRFIGKHHDKDGCHCNKHKHHHNGEHKDKNMNFSQHHLNEIHNPVKETQSTSQTE